MMMLRADIDRGSVMTVKRMIQAFVSDATGVLQMIEQKNDPGKPVQEAVRYGLGVTTDSKTYQIPVQCPDDMSEQEELLYNILFTPDGFIEVDSEIIERIILPYCKDHGLIENSFKELYKNIHGKYPDNDNDIHDLQNNFEHYEYFLMNLCPIAKGEILSNNKATMTFDTDCSHIEDKNDRPSEYTQVTVEINASGDKWEVSMISPENGKTISLSRIISPKDCGFTQD
jgi:hypothetical protein